MEGPAVAASQSVENEESGSGGSAIGFDPLGPELQSKVCLIKVN